jgi:hypothetical protein
MLEEPLVAVPVEVSMPVPVPWTTVSVPPVPAVMGRVIIAAALAPEREAKTKEPAINFLNDFMLRMMKERKERLKA